MAAFDYEIVWVARLTSKTVPPAHHGEYDRNVHDGPSSHGSFYRLHRTRCGTDEIYIELMKDGAKWAESGTDIGSWLAAGHVQALGGRFCRLCWPQGRAS